jgi:hypothetical protein
MTFVLEEAVIEAVMVIAVLAAFACLAYLVYATILERHLLNSEQPAKARPVRTVPRGIEREHAAGADLVPSVRRQGPSPA